MRFIDGYRQATCRSTKPSFLEMCLIFASAFRPPWVMLKQNTKSGEVWSNIIWNQEAFGNWDVVAHCAAHAPSHANLAAANTEGWAMAIGTNTMFLSYSAKYFSPCAGPQATFLGTNAVISRLPASQMLQSSAYAASNLTVVKVDEYLAEENPKLRVFSIHHGVRESNLSQRLTGACES